MELFDNLINIVSQGSVRRGHFAPYLPVEHKDIEEFLNIGTEGHPIQESTYAVTVTDAWLKAMVEGDEEKRKTWAKIIQRRTEIGYPYILFSDTVNNNTVDVYKDKKMKIHGSNLCSEICLPTSDEISFVCCLSSINIRHYKEWKDTDAVFNATVFLDCVAEDLLVNGSDIPGLEKAIRFTRKGRALGLGACGFHSYVQNKGWAFEGLETHLWNIEAFKKMDEESLKATQWMAKEFGEPEWCKGYGIRNTHRIAIPPTKTNSLIQGGVSEGINPDPALVYTQATSAGEVDRIAPIFLELLKKKGKYTKEVLDDIIQNNGKVNSYLNEKQKSSLGHYQKLKGSNHKKMTATKSPKI